MVVVGLTGAYAAPLFTPSDNPDAWLLFGYLAMVGASAVAVSRRGGWEYVRSVPVIASAIWLMIWVMAAWTQGDGVPVALYMAALLAGGAFARTGLAPDDSVLFKIEELPFVPPGRHYHHVHLFRFD